MLVPIIVNQNHFYSKCKGISWPNEGVQLVCCGYMVIGDI